MQCIECKDRFRKRGENPSVPMWDGHRYMKPVCYYCPEWEGYSIVDKPLEKTEARPVRYIQPKTYTTGNEGFYA